LAFRWSRRRHMIAHGGIRNQASRLIRWQTIRKARDTLSLTNTNPKPQTQLCAATVHRYTSAELQPAPASEGAALACPVGPLALLPLSPTPTGARGYGCPYIPPTPASAPGGGEDTGWRGSGMEGGGAKWVEGIRPAASTSHWESRTTYWRRGSVGHHITSPRVCSFPRVVPARGGTATKLAPSAICRRR